MRHFLECLTCGQQYAVSEEGGPFVCVHCGNGKALIAVGQQRADNLPPPFPADPRVLRNSTRRNRVVKPL